MRKLVNRALTDPKGLGDRHLRLPDEAFQILLAAADGDGRRLLNFLENAADLAEDGGEIGVELLQNLLGDSRRRFDKGGEAFYDQISALHKSVRGSSPDGALYWYARMLDGGCDPLYIARRVVRMASEDIGNADPRALTLCLNAWDVQERLGSPEGELPWPRPSSIWPVRRRAMRCTPHSRQLCVTLPSRARRRCRCTCATHRPS